MIPIDSKRIWTWYKLNWKYYLLTFPCSLRMPQLHVVCDLGVSFNMDNSWMSSTLDIAIVSAILVESHFSWTWDQYHWKVLLVLFPCICRTSKSDVVYILYINLKPR
jgi:hypothetical protein